VVLMQSLPVLLVSLSLALPGMAIAQFKWQNPDGTLGYGDRPPAHHVKMLRTPSGEVTEQVIAEAESGLPYAVKQASTRFPVVLYTGSSGTGECVPCKEGRELLTKRGIPFSEKLIKGPEDLKAFKAGISPEATVPALAVGKEKAVGFEAGAWSNLLDGAGYPKSSVLPKDYKYAVPQPLTKQAAAEPVKTEPKKENPKAGKAASSNIMVDANANANVRF
jgi:glutaredoxin